MLEEDVYHPISPPDMRDREVYKFDFDPFTATVITENGRDIIRKIFEKHHFYWADFDGVITGINQEKSGKRIISAIDPYGEENWES
jgi:hypothetical protein